MKASNLCGMLNSEVGLSCASIPPITECMVNYQLILLLLSAWYSDNMEEGNFLGDSCERI